MLLLCKLIKVNGHLYIEYNNLAPIDGNLTITQLRFIKENLYPNFFNGIKFLMSNQEMPPNNGKNLFYYLDLMFNPNMVYVFSKSQFLNLVTDAEIDSLPDPSTNIVYVFYSFISNSILLYANP